MRSIVCRFSSQADLRRAALGADHEIALPEGEPATDGEWVLAIVEVGRARRATAAAARVVARDEGSVLAFEPRDWERIASLAQGAGTEPPAADEAPVTDRSPGSSRRRPPTSPRAVASPSAKSRVLVVDDDLGICEVVGAMLEAVGLDVATVATGEQALARVDQEAFDLVLLDWTLPGIGGLELCRELRRRSASMPILFLTANASSKDVVAAFGAGADDYVVKPFRAPELGARIFGLLRRARLAKEGAR